MVCRDTFHGKITRNEVHGGSAQVGMKVDVLFLPPRFVLLTVTLHENFVQNFNQNFAVLVKVGQETVKSLILKRGAQQTAVFFPHVPCVLAIVSQIVNLSTSPHFIYWAFEKSASFPTVRSDESVPQEPFELIVVLPFLNVLCGGQDFLQGVQRCKRCYSS